MIAAFKVRVVKMYRTKRYNIARTNIRTPYKAFGQALIAYHAAVTEGVETVLVHEGGLKVELLSRTGAKLKSFEASSFENNSREARAKVRQIVKEVRVKPKRQRA